MNASNATYFPWRKSYKVLISHFSESFNKCALVESVNSKGKIKTLVLSDVMAVSPLEERKYDFIIKDLELRIIISDLYEWIYNGLN